MKAKKKQGEMHNLQNDNFDHYILYLCKFNLHIMEKKRDRTQVRRREKV